MVAGIQGFTSSYTSRFVHHVVGLMSGTSLDGVDAALVRIETDQSGKPGAVQLVAHHYKPYSDGVRQHVAALCSTETARVDNLTLAHFGLSEWYAAAVEGVILEAGIDRSLVDCVSMHGQTVWHAPVPHPFPGPGSAGASRDVQVRGTLQLGSAAVVAERTGLPVVHDLRSRDMAAGGEGAPLAPYIDAILFGSRHEGRIVQNIGGIGNATVLPAGTDGTGVIAFDTGPGNMIMDAVVLDRTAGSERYDDAGRYAAAGSVDMTIVALLMKDPYFGRKPPKSTGREVYGAPFARRFIQMCDERGLSFNDAVATATAFTAESIAAAYRDFVLPSTRIERVLVAGGGALNPTLLAMMAARLPGIAVETTGSAGVPDQAREAMAFALLGHESIMGRPSNLPTVTGASHPVILGCITL